jgi:hypothetical protein
MHVLHSCDNPSCVNVNHLRWGSHTENVRDKINRNRCNFPKNENHHFTKFKDDVVVKIKQDVNNGLTRKNISIKYGVSVSHIQYLINKRNVISSQMDT